MRNTTKLKAILLMYKVTFEMNDDEVLTMTLSNKNDGESMEFEGKAYSGIMSKAYSYMLRELKKEEKDFR